MNSIEKPTIISNETPRSSNVLSKDKEKTARITIRKLFNFPTDYKNATKTRYVVRKLVPFYQIAINNGSSMDALSPFANSKMNINRQRKTLGIVRKFFSNRPPFASSKFGRFLLPKARTLAMKSFVATVVVYSTVKANVWGTQEETNELWTKFFMETPCTAAINAKKLMQMDYNRTISRLFYEIRVLPISVANGLSSILYFVLKSNKSRFE